MIKYYTFNERNSKNILSVTVGLHIKDRKD